MKQKYLILGIILLLLPSTALSQTFDKSILNQDSVVKLADDNLYIVIFREWSNYNKEQVLSVEGVQYIKDTTFGEQESPAIIISAKQTSVDKIKKFNFVSNIQPTILEIDPMPKVTTIDTSTITFSVIMVLLIVAALLIKKFRK